MVFPPKHSYYKDCPDEYLNLYGTANFTKEGKNLFVTGMNIDPSRTKDKRAQEQAQARVDAAGALANYFDDDVYLLPEMNTLDPRHDLYFENAPMDNASPDFLIGKNYYEMEGYEGNFKYNNITQMLRRGAEQSDRIILKIDDTVDLDTVKNKINGAMTKSSVLKDSVKEVFVIDNDKNVYQMY